MKHQQPAEQQPGALVIGGDYMSLGVVRSLGRQGIPVWVMHNGHSLAAYSRYARHSMPWPALDEAGQVAFLVETAQKHGLKGWTIIPTKDGTTRLIARNQNQLAEYFQLKVSAWEAISQLTDKRQLYELAAEVGVPHPWTFYNLNRDQITGLECDYPVILKPAEHIGSNPFLRDKAWKVMDAAELLKRYDKAREYVAPEMIMVQEWIPGSGEEQYSYAALWQEGRPLAELLARRIRQYPRDFGRFSTYVESIDQPEVEAYSQRLLSATNYTGLIELEYKRDPQNGQFKLLDANARVWGWHTLGQRAGLDFSYLLWQMTHGATLAERRGRAGVRWVRMSADILVVLKEIRARQLTPKGYLDSLRGPLETAIFAPDDPLPGLVDLPLLVMMAWKRGGL